MPDLKNPLVLALGAALLIGALVLLRPRAGGESGGGASAGGAGPSARGPGEHTAERQAQIDAGEAEGLRAQRAGELTGELAGLDVDHRARERFEVVVGDPRQGVRDEPRIVQVASTAETDDAVRRYFWQTLQDSGAGFFYPGPTGTGALVLIEHPRGRYHACQLMPTEWVTRQSWVQAYFVDPLRIRGIGGQGIRHDSVARMHRPTDGLVRVEDSLRSGMRLTGAGSVRQVFEHFPTWWIHHREYLMRPSEILARSIAVPADQQGRWSLICAMEQGDNLGGSAVLSQWVTPLPWVWHAGHNVWVDGDMLRTERNLLAVPDSMGKVRLARLHPKTGQPWRCFSFAQSYAVPENPAWSFVWWTPWYPQHRDDGAKQPGQLPQTFEPHLGGGSQLSPAFAAWILPPSERSRLGFAGTGHPPPPDTAWVGGIKVGLPQDCVRLGDLVRCEVDRPPDTRSPCGFTGGADDLWRIDYGAPGGDWCPPPVSEKTGTGAAAHIASLFGGSLADSGRFGAIGEKSGGAKT